MLAVITLWSQAVHAETYTQVQRRNLANDRPRRLRSQRIACRRVARRCTTWGCGVVVVVEAWAAWCAGQPCASSVCAVVVLVVALATATQSKGSL